MTRAECLQQVVAALPSGIARRVVRETLAGWPDDDVAEWHRMKDRQRKAADFRSGEKRETGKIPAGVPVAERKNSGPAETVQPEIPPPPPPPSPEPPSSPAPAPAYTYAREDVLPVIAGPSLGDVEAEFHRSGGTSAMAMTFHAKWSAVGWTDGRNPIRNWRILVPSYIANWRDFDERDRQRAAGRTQRQDAASAEAGAKAVALAKPDPSKLKVVIRRGLNGPEIQLPSQKQADV